MTIMLSLYLKEIKGIKNLFILRDIQIDKWVFKYNLTLYGLPALDELIPEDINLHSL